MSSIALVIPYFGKFPNYFNLFLKSCKYNSNIDWYIFTDNIECFDYPPNVKKIEMSFQECQSLIRNKFDFNVNIDTYNKLCDYKVAYGYIFSAYLSSYDFWGYCDVDLIFGDLNKYLNEEILNSYEKIYSLGHLTLFKNSEENNMMFMSEINGRFRYKEVFSVPKGCAFDEWYPESINDIYLNSQRPFLMTCNCADVSPYKSRFVLEHFIPEERSYTFGKEKNNIFLWDNGKLFRYYIRKGKVNKSEHIYVHLQKRKMKDLVPYNSNSFIIVPNRFIDNTGTIKSLLCISNFTSIFNFQFIKVKYRSLKSRIKKRNWKNFLFNRNIKRI